MATQEPFFTKVTRLSHENILPSPIVIEYSDLLYYALASCLQASQTFLEQGNAFESDRCFDIMQSLLMIDPEDETTMILELKSHGFSVAHPIDCCFIEHVIHDNPDGAGES